MVKLIIILGLITVSTPIDASRYDPNLMQATIDARISWGHIDEHHVDAHDTGIAIKYCNFNQTYLLYDVKSERWITGVTTDCANRSDPYTLNFMNYIDLELGWDIAEDIGYTYLGKRDMYRYNFGVLATKEVNYLSMLTELMNDTNNKGLLAQRKNTFRRILPNKQTENRSINKNFNAQNRK